MGTPKKTAWRGFDLGLPDNAIRTFGTANKNTTDEAAALKGWAEQNATSVSIVPAGNFFARRGSWVFRRKFSGSAVQIEVPAFEPGAIKGQRGGRRKEGEVNFK